MMDLSTEAMEEDLQTAEMGGVPRGQIALVRAQIRATLAAVQPPAAPQAAGTPDFLHLPTEGGSADIQIAEGPFGDSYSVPTAASWPDRLEAAARLIGFSLTTVRELFEAAGYDYEGQWREPIPEAPTDVELDIEDERGTDPVDLGGMPAADEDDGIDEDFFAEARKSRGK